MTDRIRVHIPFGFKEGPFGGGNQFLKALRHFFREHDIYSETPEESNVILFNSDPTSLCRMSLQMMQLKRSRSDLMLFNRVDGPIQLVRGRQAYLDTLIILFSQFAADGTIFQSDWSRRRLLDLGMTPNESETTIINAPDPALFNKDKGGLGSHSNKIRIIATSWSSNWGKGFDVYQWIDANLDFDRYEMTFVGNSPISFRNIRMVSPVKPEELSRYLKTSDIFITASRNDPCSNALIEALHCGLPALALSDGGHPELVGSRGELFSKAEEVPGLLETIVAKYQEYAREPLPSLSETGQQYLDFFSLVRSKTGVKPKVPHHRECTAVAALMMYARVRDRIEGILKRISL